MTVIVWDDVSGPAGCALVAVREEQICWLGFTEQGRDKVLDSFHRMWGREELVHKYHPLMSRALGETPPPDLPVFLTGTPFQQEVWAALRTIPRGQTTTYGAIAAQVGRPRAFRAVGQAIGANPVCWLIPCHRVRHAHGLSSGYRWGVACKERLLRLEQD